MSKPAGYHPSRGVRALGNPYLGAATPYVQGLGFAGEDTFSVTMRLNSIPLWRSGLDLNTLHPMFSLWSRHTPGQTLALGDEGYIPLMVLGVAPNGSVGAKIGVLDYVSGEPVAINILTVQSQPGLVSPDTGAFTISAATNAWSSMRLIVKRPLNTELPSTFQGEYILDGNVVTETNRAGATAGLTAMSAIGVFANQGGLTRVDAHIYECGISPEGRLPLAWFFDDRGLDPVVPCYEFSSYDNEWNTHAYRYAIPLSQGGTTDFPQWGANDLDLTIQIIEPLSRTDMWGDPRPLASSYRYDVGAAYRRVAPAIPTYRPIAPAQETT